MLTNNASIVMQYTKDLQKEVTITILLLPLLYYYYWKKEITFWTFPTMRAQRWLDFWRNDPIEQREPFK